MIRLALNQKSCENFTLIEFLKFSKDFDGVELNFKKIKGNLSENVKLKDILEHMEIYNLKLSSIFRLKDFSLSSDMDFKKKILKNLKQMLDYCYKLEGNLIIVNPSLVTLNFNTEISKWRIINRTRKRLEIISKIALNDDINVGFEFLHLENSSISTLNDAIEVLTPFESSQENLGYVIDSFHYAKSKADFSQLKDIKELIFLIQLSDLRYDTTNSANDSTYLRKVKRVFPGEGDFEDFKLKDFINYTRKIGYRKMYSIELLKKDCLKDLYKKFFRIFKIV